MKKRAHQKITGVQHQDRILAGIFYFFDNGCNPGPSADGVVVPGDERSILDIGGGCEKVGVHIV